MLVLAALVAAGPAAAQFGSIFNQPPPRPPADVPSAPPSPPPSDRRAPPPFFPSREPAVRSDEPPQQPLPAPMSLPPQNRPGAAGIQQQELPPPPGAEQAARPPSQQPAVPLQTLPGLPPGQRQPPGTPQQGNQPAANAPQGPAPQNETVVEPPPQRIPNPTAVFAGLDKITGRITSFDVAINETVQFGALQVTPRVCYSRPPTETPQTDSFVEVDEVTLLGKIQRIFTGWMFAASPGLHAVEHPIYDVWLTDFKGGQNPAVADTSADVAAPKPAAKPARPAAPAPRRPVQPRAQQPAGTLPPLR